MHILILTNSVRPYSGWGRCASDLIAGIRNAGHSVTILKEEDDGYEGISILKRGAGIFWSACRVRRYAKECDVVHALDGYPYGIIAALAAIGLKKKVVITAIGTYSVEPLYRVKTSKLLSWAYRKASRVVCISRFTMDQILKKVPLRNIGVVNLGINVAAYDTELEVPREQFILSVGALKQRKGYHISIPAYGMVKKRYPEMTYKIVGSQKDARYKEILLDLIRKQGIEGIEFIDEISDRELHSLYSRARVFVLTSVNHSHHFEGYGLVCLEAAAMGLPVVATRGNGIEDAVRDGYNGVLVDRNDINGTAQAICEVVGDEARWAVMSTHGRLWAKQHDNSMMIRPYLDMYTTHNE